MELLHPSFFISIIFSERENHFHKKCKKSEFVIGELYFFELLMFSEIYFLLHLHIDRLINLEHYLHIIDIIVSTALIFCIFVC